MFCNDKNAKFKCKSRVGFIRKLQKLLEDTTDLYRLFQDQVDADKIGFYSNLSRHLFRVFCLLAAAAVFEMFLEERQNVYGFLNKGHLR